MCFVFFFNDTATTEIYTLSLHDALPIWSGQASSSNRAATRRWTGSPSRLRSRTPRAPTRRSRRSRSEEHTSELQSRQYLVCRLLLEKKKKRENKTSGEHETPRVCTCNTS